MRPCLATATSPLKEARLAAWFTCAPREEERVSASARAAARRTSTSVRNRPKDQLRRPLYERTFARYNGRPMAADELVVHGAREHNLKDVTVRLPRNALICITGLSGSGKSSLAFDTIYAEGQRRYVESLSAYARQ